MIKQAKYSTILLDCTPDLSHKEQFSIVIRFVNIEKNQVKIEEKLYLSSSLILQGKA